MSKNTAWIMIGALLAVCLILTMFLGLTWATLHKAEIVSFVSAMQKIRVSYDSTEEGFSVEVTNQEMTFSEKVEQTLDEITDIWGKTE